MCKDVSKNLSPPSDVVDDIGVASGSGMPYAGVGWEPPERRHSYDFSSSSSSSAELDSMMSEAQGHLRRNEYFLIILLGSGKQ